MGDCELGKVQGVDGERGGEGDVEEVFFFAVVVLGAVAVRLLAVFDSATDLRSRSVTAIGDQNCIFTFGVKEPD